MRRLAGVTFTDLTQCATGQKPIRLEVRTSQRRLSDHFLGQMFVSLLSSRSICLESLHSYFLHLLLRLDT